MQFNRRWLSLLAGLLAFALVAAACGGDDETTASEDFKIGILLVGPGNDRGYSQAHLEGAEYAIEKLGLNVDDNLLVLEFANFGDTPGLSFTGTANEMVDLGADLIIFNSDDMRDGAFEAAAALPEVPMIWNPSRVCSAA